MTQEQRQTFAAQKARTIVSRLRASNERAARLGAPVVSEKDYIELEEIVTRKLLRL